MRPSLGIISFKLVIVVFAQQGAGANVHQVLLLFLRKITRALAEFLHTYQKQNGIKVGFIAKLFCKQGNELLPLVFKDINFVFVHRTYKIINKLKFYSYGIKPCT